MSKTMDPVEHRIHKRYRVKESAYVTLRGPVSKLGQVIDVSKGGLSFRYIDIGERPRNSLELNLNIKNNGFQLENITFKSIYDLRATKEFPFSSTRIRRRGGQFVALTIEQESGLEYLIEHYSTGEV